MKLLYAVLTEVLVPLLIRCVVLNENDGMREERTDDKCINSRTGKSLPLESSPPK